MKYLFCKLVSILLTFIIKLHYLINENPYLTFLSKKKNNKSIYFLIIFEISQMNKCHEINLY